MDEKELNSVSATTTEADNNQYIEALKEMKANSVRREEYDALRAENKKLLDAVINGQPAEQTEVVKPEVDLSELRNNLFNNENQTNLEYVSNALKLREAILEKDGKDIFVPIGSQYNPTAADYEKAHRVATILQEMVDESAGDPNVFLNEYQRRVRDTNISRRK